MKLEGQVALITGGSRGLGLAIAQALAAEGAALGLVARDGAELEKAVQRLSASGARALGAEADVTRAADVERAVRAVLERWNRLDILVLNAGTWQGAKIHEMTEAAWDQLLALNLKGAFLTLKAALPTLIAQKRGTIVGISSLGGLVGQPGSSAYAASKWGLRGLLESAALELKPHHIRVSIVYPHNMNSAGRAIDPGSPDRNQSIEPGEVASLVAWICCAPGHVSVGNVSIWPIDAGITWK
ncbi:MAG TPA: SDR family NAD(P)-dependent oxidoreductase [Candidatus Eisenbacteria bacterium]|jgi:NAD(P)-dependent dehydrogenase (short-subunit alcohol dehydrogenase family)